jgi:isopentenyl-diphosphate delta-isomerase
MAKEEVVLVDEKDNDVGREEKIKAHMNGGKLHRAFSIFIFNGKGEMMIQQRAFGKYHCGGLWTNTCCSHPRPGELAENAAHRKLKQEMGFDTDLKEILSFTYRAPFENGLTEHEFDHVFVGGFDGNPQMNPQEVGDFKWVNPNVLEKDVNENPDKYTPWFKIVLARVLEWYRENKVSFQNRNA